MLETYVRRRLARYESVEGGDEVYEACSILWHYMPKCCVEERDRIGTFKFFIMHGSPTGGTRVA